LAEKQSTRIRASKEVVTKNILEFSRLVLILYLARIIRAVIQRVRVIRVRDIKSMLV
jgi:hypothetical protein